MNIRLLFQYLCFPDLTFSHAKFVWRIRNKLDKILFKQKYIVKAEDIMYFYIIKSNNFKHVE